MTGPQSALLVAVCLGALVLIRGVLTTPWRPLAGAVVHPDPARDLSGHDIARAKRYFRAANPPRLLGFATGLAAPVVLGLTTAGSRLSIAARPHVPWLLAVVVNTLLVLAIVAAVTVPFSAWRESVARRYGLSVQSWPRWAADAARSFGVSAVLGTIGLVALVGLARALPGAWWAAGAVAAAGFVVAAAFAFPLIIEPLFNKFVPMAPGALREDFLAMAARDGLRVSEVLVADASRRTTALNAYVSGFGATRRIVVYDTLLQRPDDEVRLVVAHELGHAVYSDVLEGSIMAAAAAAAGVAALGFLSSSNTLLRVAGVDGPGDPRSVALLIALVVILSAVAGPAFSLVSRRVESRADIHSLDTTGDAAVFTRAMRELAITNIANPRPNALLHALFADHPSVPERIALARSWAQLHGAAVPPDLAERTAR